ncbi:MAG: HAMP domain-containing protein [Catenulispora sp.]|nr:HAMP domain-containing protein [Catenulispora sp.]
MREATARTRSVFSSRWFPAAWRTARVRISILFGAGFLLFGLGLLAVSNVLVQRTTGATVYTAPPGRKPGPAAQPDSGSATFFQSGPTAAADREIQTQLGRLHTSDIHQFLIRSGITLAVAVLAAFVLGYLVAGRVLRPVRDIAAKAQAISAHNLHERLSLSGPADELKELGDTFDALLERLEHAFRAQRRFIANASHELRTPLTRQLTLAEIALGDPEPSIESLRAAHERVVAAVREQERIIEALLTLARGQAGTDRREPVDLASLAEHIAITAHPRHPGIDMRIDLEHAPVSGDPQLLERLIANLVDNAGRHNTADGWIELSAGVHDGRAVLSVGNSGPMIPTDSIPRLTEPFQRLDTDRTSTNSGGLGLGLSIVAAVAHAHDADLTIRPRADGGIAVEVSFPTLCR